MPLPRNGAVLTALDDVIYLTGGFCAEGRNASYDILCFDVNSEMWSRPVCAGKKIIVQRDGVIMS